MSSRRDFRHFPYIYTILHLPPLYDGWVFTPHVVWTCSAGAQPDPYNMNNSPDVNIPDEVFVIVGNVTGNGMSLWGEKVEMMSDFILV